MIFSPIYKYDSKGKIRVWFMEIQGKHHRTISGILKGNLVTTQWTACVGKQGRSDEAQAVFEVEAAYRHKLAREYHQTLEAIKDGAHFFKPMLAKGYKKWPEPCFTQPKLDGARCIATNNGLFSRQGKPFISVPHIWEALKPVFEKDPSIILDGELYNHDLKDDFGQIMSLIRQQNPSKEDLEKSAKLIQYHIYDLPSHSGLFHDRNLAINKMFPLADYGSIRVVHTNSVNTSDELDMHHANWVTAGYEGSMVRLNRPYEQKRSNNLLKRKEFYTEEFPVVRIEEGLGNWTGIAKRVICVLPDGRTFGAGIKATQERAAKLLHEKWKEATIKFFEFTPDGIPRFPVAVDFHNGREY